MKSKRPQKKTRREKKRLKKKAIIVVSSILIIIASFFYIMNHEYLAISEVHVLGQRTIIEQDIHDVVQEHLDKRIFSSIRGDNLIFLNTQSIYKELKAKFPKIQELDVQKKDGEVLVITVGERAVHSLWCVNREYESVFDEECYFSDSEGLLYARAPYFSGNIYVKLFFNPTESIDYLGTYVDQIESFDEFFSFIDSLEEVYPLSLGNVTFSEFGDVFIDIARFNNYIYHQDRPVLRYNQDHSYETIARDIGIVLEFNDFMKMFTQNPDLLESIDVRFENRVLYTFTPQEQAEI